MNKNNIISELNNNINSDRGLSEYVEQLFWQNIYDRSSYRI